MKIHIFLKYNLQLFPQNKILMHKCNKTFKGCVASKLQKIDERNQRT